MSDCSLPMIEDSIWNHFGDECDRRNDFFYDICTPGINDLEDVDRILGYDFGQQSIGFGAQSEALQSVPKCQGSSYGEIKSQSAVQMEVDDSDIAAVVKSSFQPINTGNNLNNYEMLEKRYSSTATRNQPADHMNRSTYGLDQIQIFEDKNPLPPCSSGLSSKQNHCGAVAYTSSYNYNTGNPQFQLENRLLPDQCMGRLFDPSSKPPLSHGQELHNALMADQYRHGQASCSTFQKEGQRTHRHQHEGSGGIKVEGTGRLELPPFNTDLTVQEECARSFGMDATVQDTTSCMKQVFSNDVNLEATNLLQLHNVMNEMDVGTRRCISNSLYRLARSSIQRPNLSDLSNGSSESVIARSSKRLAEGTDANTNLLDQSIAKLLFYKPLDLATSSSAEAMLLKSGMLIGIPL